MHANLSNALNTQERWTNLLVGLIPLPNNDNNNNNNNSNPGEVDNLARTYSSSVDLPEVYTSLTDTSTVVRKILQTTITVGLITNNVSMESKHEIDLIAVDFQERWLDRCKCSLVKSSRFSWGKSFTQGRCSSLKRSTRHCQVWL